MFVTVYNHNNKSLLTLFLTFFLRTTMPLNGTVHLGQFNNQKGEMVLYLLGLQIWNFF